VALRGSSPFILILFPRPIALAAPRLRRVAKEKREKDKKRKGKREKEKRKKRSGETERWPLALVWARRDAAARQSDETVTKWIIFR